MTTNPSGTARHGTRHGYRDDKCKCAVCKKAIALEHNVYKLRRAANGGAHLTVDKTGAVRRIYALMALGWPRRELAKRAGYDSDAFGPVVNGTRQRLTLATHVRIVALYDDLSMTLGPSASSRQRNSHRVPPLAWDDDTIDDPTAKPARVNSESRRHSIDTTVIERFLARDITPGLWANLAEKREIVRRWDGSLAELERMTGWATHRYTEREDVA